MQSLGNAHAINVGCGDHKNDGSRDCKERQEKEWRTGNALEQQVVRGSVVPADTSPVVLSFRKKRERLPTIDTLLRITGAMEVDLGKLLGKAKRDTGSGLLMPSREND